MGSAQVSLAMLVVCARAQRARGIWLPHPGSKSCGVPVVPLYSSFSSGHGNMHKDSVIHLGTSDLFRKGTGSKKNQG